MESLTRLSVELPCNLASPRPDTFLKELKSRDSSRHVHTHVCSGVIHTRQKVEVAWGSVRGCPPGVPRVVRLLETENSMSLGRAWGASVHEDRVLVWDEKVLETMVVVAECASRHCAP